MVYIYIYIYIYIYDSVYIYIICVWQLATGTQRALPQTCDFLPLAIFFHWVQPLKRGSLRPSRRPLHRGLANSGEVEEYCQWTGLLCRDQDGVTGLPDRATCGTSWNINQRGSQFRAAHLADFSGLGFCLVNYLPRTRSWLVPDCYNPMTWWNKSWFVLTPPATTWGINWAIRLLGSLLARQSEVLDHESIKQWYPNHWFHLVSVSRNDKLGMIWESHWPSLDLRQESLHVPMFLCLKHHILATEYRLFYIYYISTWWFDGDFRLTEQIRKPEVSFARTLDVRCGSCTMTREYLHIATTSQRPLNDHVCLFFSMAYGEVARCVKIDMPTVIRKSIHLPVWMLATHLG